MNVDNTLGRQTSIRPSLHTHFACLILFLIGC